MGFFNFSNSNERKAKISHIKDLLAVAFADGKIHPREIQLLETILKREGLEKNEVDKILQNPDVEIVRPESVERQAKYLQDLVIMMMVDGDINENEKELCKSIALSYGYDPGIIDAFILETLREATS